MKLFDPSKFVRIEVISLLVLILVVPIGFAMNNTTDSGYEIEAKNETFELMIEVSQWEYKVYDLNAIADFNALDAGEKVEFEMRNPRLNVNPGFDVIIHLKSRDVSHGLRFDEVEFQLITDRADRDVEFSPTVSGNFTLPSDDIVLDGYPPFDVGLGTNDMKVKLIVGDPYLPVNIFFTILLTGLISTYIYFSYNILVSKNSSDTSE